MTPMFCDRCARPSHHLLPLTLPRRGLVHICEPCERELKQWWYLARQVIGL